MSAVPLTPTPPVEHQSWYDAAFWDAGWREGIADTPMPQQSTSDRSWNAYVAGRRAAENYRKAHPNE